MRLEIVEAKGRAGGRSSWDEDEIKKILKDVEKMIEENGFALLTRDRMLKAYRGNATDQYKLSMLRRKLKELFPDDKYEIAYYERIVARDEKGKLHTFDRVYKIEPVA